MTTVAPLLGGDFKVLKEVYSDQLSSGYTISFDADGRKWSLLRFKLGFVGQSLGIYLGPLTLMYGAINRSKQDGSGAHLIPQGNVNTSKFGGRLNGCGGFIDISQNSRAVVFAGTFTAGGLEIAIEDGKLRIVKEGRARKFVRAVEQITFSGPYAASKSQPVIYVTERCVNCTLNGCKSCGISDVGKRPIVFISIEATCVYINVAVSIIIAGCDTFTTDLICQSRRFRGVGEQHSSNCIS